MMLETGDIFFFPFMLIINFDQTFGEMKKERK
jgi:hypothetical protein